MIDNVVTLNAPLQPVPKERSSSQAAKARLAARHRAERRFKFYGLAAIVAAGGFLCAIVADIVVKARPAFTKSQIALDVPVTSDLVDPAAVKNGDFDGVLRTALRSHFPTVTSRSGRKALDAVLSSAAADALRAQVIANPALVGTTVKVNALMSSDADLFVKGLASRTATFPGRGAARITIADDKITISLEDGALSGVFERFGGALGEAITLDATKPSLLFAIAGGVVKATSVDTNSIVGAALIPLPATAADAVDKWHMLILETPEGDRKIPDSQAAAVALLQETGRVHEAANWSFFSEGDSREPEQAGILGALAGTALTMLVTLGLCLPIGVGAAIYLETFAPKNRWTHLIEVNINNLAAVPSIVFGLLGLAVFLGFGGLPRSSSLVGGLVLALLVLPTIIIASRAAIKSVPPSIQEAALALGATHQQTVFHHVLPVALPGIMTGTIIGMAHALGETAPLLMIGMVAFIADVPHSLTEAATVLPVQIFLWSDLPEIGFQAKTAAAILVLLIFLVAMNAIAIFLRRKFERRW